MTKSSNRIFKLVAIAVFIAVAYISSIILPIKVGFLTLDIKDAFITIGALYLGPLSGAIISAVVSIMETALGSDTGFYGLIMNFFGSAAFAVVASLIYKNKKSLISAVISLVLATVCMTAVMLAANLIFTPLYMGVPRNVVVGMIIPTLLPFNLVKGILNAAIVMLLYKPVSQALKRTRIGKSQNSTKLNKYTAVVAICALLVLILSLVLVFVGLGGELELGKNQDVAETTAVTNPDTDEEHIGLSDRIISFFSDTVGVELCTFIISMIPIIELRGAIIFGIGVGLNPIFCYILCVIGNMLPVPIILLFVRRVLEWMKNVKYLDRIANWVFQKADKHSVKVTKYATWGLFLFVAIPIPGTGAWTGSLIAALLNMRLKKSLPSIFAGVCAAGVIMTLGSIGIFSIFG